MMLLRNKLVAVSILLSLVFSLVVPASASAAILNLKLTDFSSGLTRPVKITNSGVGGDTRMFVVEQPGKIRIVSNTGVLSPTPFLDIEDDVLYSGEQGLLGLAFHPNYNVNGFIYVFYVNNDGDLTISRFTRDGGDPNLIDDTTEQQVMEIPHPTNGNHNGGDLAFNLSNGLLYIATGDGGSGNDPPNNAQNKSVNLGKILRIDIDDDDFPADATKNYGIPAGNPFVGVSGNDEIWSYGLRNPWRFSFDRDNMNMYIGDVGQGNREEIDFQKAGTAGGLNFGWRCREGSIANPSNPSGCSGFSGYTNPIAEYSNGPKGSCAVTGGFMYRGTDHPKMYGWYYFADYCNGYVYALKNDGTRWSMIPRAEFSGHNIGTFGEDIDGELFVGDVGNGHIYRLDATDFAPFYRMFSVSRGDNMNTANFVDREALQHGGLYKYIGQSGYISTITGAGLTPLYRMYSESRRDTMFTPSADTANKLRDSGLYRYIGIAGYVSTSAGAGKTPLYALYSHERGDNMYTTSLTEKNNLVARGDYKYIGIIGYMFTAQ